MRAKPPFGIGSLISDMLKGMDMETRVKEQTCLLVWDDVVGEQVASAAQPEFIRDGKLFVVAKSAVWANELTFYKQGIMEKLNRRAGGNVVKEIIFKSGRFPAKKQEPSDQTAAKPDLEGIQLSESELESVETMAIQAGEGAEDVRRLLTTALRLEKWKQSNGWKPCRECGVLQNSEDGVCPVCRL
jgi:predicted nucleic acid-binding Zn ribbon protein